MVHGAAGLRETQLAVRAWRACHRTGDPVGSRARYAAPQAPCGRGPGPVAIRSKNSAPAFYSRHDGENATQGTCRTEKRAIVNWRVYAAAGTRCLGGAGGFKAFAALRSCTGIRERRDPCDGVRVNRGVVQGVGSRWLTLSTDWACRLGNNAGRLRACAWGEGWAAAPVVAAKQATA